MGEWMTEKIINIEKIDHITSLFGNYDENVKEIEKQFNVKILNRDAELKISGDNDTNVELATKTILKIIETINNGNAVNIQSIKYLITLVLEGSEEKLSQLNDCICITSRGKPVKPKTIGQKNYIDAIKNNTIVFSIGPAGTGKTYLAVAMAVAAFKAKEINRIVLTRPAVEAGEKLGFLPGDLQDKVDPYLRPLYDALNEMLGAENVQKYQEKLNIEVAPLAYMRGRTLDDSFIILDEAQNTTPEQMKMFLTRLGFNSKIVITGDVTQIDLPFGKRSGLIEASEIVKDVEGISVFKFSDRDVVRHQLVQNIIKAYDRFEQEGR